MFHILITTTMFFYQVIVSSTQPTKISELFETFIFYLVFNFVTLIIIVFTADTHVQKVITLT